MKKYKITYNENPNYNLTEEINADNPKEAIVKFNLKHPTNNEIVRVEEVG